jgi:hypothetical protein
MNEAVLNVLLVFEWEFIKLFGKLCQRAEERSSQMRDKLPYRRVLVWMTIM